MADTEEAIAQRQFEGIVMELHSRIEENAGKREARHYLQWANGILVFFPKGLRNTVVQGYGRIIASQGTELADFYFAQLKELFRLEQKRGKKKFPLTARAAEEGAELLCRDAGSSRVMGLLRGRVLGQRSKRRAEELFKTLKEQLNP